MSNKPIQKQTAVALARGTARLLSSLGYIPITEFSLETGRRVDVFGIAKNGSLIAVEVKSTREDFLSDQKWPEYLDYCDQFYFAVPEVFPDTLLPEDQGLMKVDEFTGAIIRAPKPSPVKPARRKAILTRFGRTAAARLSRFTDPEGML